MRKLNTQDAFKMARLLKYAGVKELIINAYKNNDKLNAEELGIEVIFTLIDSFGDSKVEKDFYDLIGGITEKGADAILNQDLSTTIDDIKAIWEQNDMATFFNSVSRLGLKN